jgi:hypothetical protein
MNPSAQLTKEDSDLPVILRTQGMIALAREREVHRQVEGTGMGLAPLCVLLSEKRPICRLRKWPS